MDQKQVQTNNNSKRSQQELLEGQATQQSRSDSSYSVLCNGIEKSVSDERDFLSFQLANGLRVLVVSDPTCDKAGAGLSVEVGHFADERDLPGLAHFLEHMVFMGTQKYPDENEYSAFLSKCGGSSNACTEAEVTSFFFDVNHPSLHDVLDRFAQFFISPLMNESSQEREVRAVNNEHSKNLLSDPWRFQQLERSTSSPSHAYSKFGTGDLKTLETIPRERGVNVRTKLLEFHQKHYKANRMGLVVVGRESVDTLRGWIEGLFSPVPNDGPSTIVCERPPNPEYMPGTLFPQNVLDRILFVEPIQDKYTIEVAWEIPSVIPEYQKGMSRYAEHLLGHEGKGSLLANLKERELAVALVSGVFFECSDFAVLKIAIECTERGAREGFREVLRTTFEYCDVIRTSGVQEAIFREIQLLDELRFRFQSKPDVFQFCRSASSALLKFPVREVLTAQKVVKEYDPRLIQSVLDLLVPQKARVTVSFQRIKQAFPELTWQQEQWYGTVFAIDNKSLSETIASATPNSNLLALPMRNPFIPTDFTLCAPKAETQSEKRQMQLRAPSRASGTPATLDVWYKQDRTYGQPKCVFKCQLIAPGCYSSPRASVLAELAAMVVTDTLAEYAYDAQVAGLSWSWTNSVKGMVLTVAGHNDKLRVLLDKVVETVTAEQTYLDEKMLQRQLERYARSLENFWKENPYQIAIYGASVALNTPRWNYKEKSATLKARKVTVRELADFVKLNIISSASKLVVMCIGNITRLKAIEWSESVWSKFSFETSFSPVPPRVVAVPEGKTHFLREQCDNVNSALEFVCQLGSEIKHGNRLAALCHVLTSLSDEPCFNELRTVQQLGYIVHLGLRKDGTGVWALRIVIQSGTHPLDDLVERTFRFLEGLGSILEGYSDESFREHVKSCVQNRLEADLSLAEEARRWWDEIEQGVYKFDRDEVLAREIASITRREVKDFFNTYIHPTSATMRRFFISGIDARNGTPAGPSEHVSKNVAATKKKASLEQKLMEEKFGQLVCLGGGDLAAWRDSCELWPYIDRTSAL